MFLRKNSATESENSSFSGLIVTLLSSKNVSESSTIFVSETLHKTFVFFSMSSTMRNTPSDFPCLSFIIISLIQSTTSRLSFLTAARQSSAI